MTELSPATQAVVNAAVDITGYGKETPLLKARLAAAIEALADQVVPSTEPIPQKDLGSRREAMIWGMINQTQVIRRQILAIAAELNNSNHTSEENYDRG